MADIKISQLPEVSSLSPSDVLPSVASSVTSKITVQNLASTIPQVSSSISASYAITASYALNGGGSSTPAFPYTGSARITGSLNVIGDSITTGSYKLTGSLIISDAVGSVLISTKNSNSVAAGLNTVATISTASYDGAFFDYVVKRGTNVRVGTVASVWNATTYSYMDNSTTDLGNTSEVVFSVDLVGDNARLNVNVDTSTWTVKTLVRAL